MKRGFSLIECLVAIGLFGIAVAVLMMSVSNLMHAISPHDESAEMRFRYEYVMRCVREAPTREAIARGGDLTTPDGVAIRWRGRVEPAETADLHRLTVEFTPNTPDMKPATTTLHALVLNPKWSDPAERESRLSKQREQIARENSDL